MMSQRNGKRLRTRHHDIQKNESYFVLIGGESHLAQGNSDRSKREFQHTSVPFIGNAYEQLRKAGIPRRRIITICQLEDYRTTLLLGEQGKLVDYGHEQQVVAPKFYKQQRQDTDQHCRLLLEEGGSDYDFEMVNPATVWNVLTGEGNHFLYHKVVPRAKSSALFFAIYSHGDSHAALFGAGNDDDPLKAEWFAHFPYPPLPTQQRTDFLDFVATENAPPGESHYYLYSTQLRRIFHQLFSNDKKRPVIGLLNYCTSGGNLEFMRRPAVVKSFGVDQWPLFLMSSSGKSADSLVAGLWQSVFSLLSSCLIDDINDSSQHRKSGTFQSLFDKAVCQYHQENLYNLLNECKERAFSYPIWQLTFHEYAIDSKAQLTKSSSIDPWHKDLRQSLLTKDGHLDQNSLQELQHAYASGKAFRIIHQRHFASNELLMNGILAVDGTIVMAQHLDKPNHYVIWARQAKADDQKRQQAANHDSSSATRSLSAWLNFPHSKPYRCPITAWQGENAGHKVELTKDVAMEAFDAIAKPDFVCGANSGIQNADVCLTLGDSASHCEHPYEN